MVIDDVKFQGFQGQPRQHLILYIKNSAYSIFFCVVPCTYLQVVRLVHIVHTGSILYLWGPYLPLSLFFSSLFSRLVPAAAEIRRQPLFESHQTSLTPKDPATGPPVEQASPLHGRTAQLINATAQFRQDVHLNALETLSRIMPYHSRWCKNFEFHCVRSRRIQ
jgi:hypothetical protein